MNPKLKEELLDLAHLLHQAIITDDDRIAEAALADMADALASILPVDNARPSVGADVLTAERSETAEGRRPKNPFYTVAPGVTLVRFAGKDAVTLMAKRPGNNSALNPSIFKVFVDKVHKVGSVLCDDKTLFQIVGRECQSASRIERLCISALHRILKDRRNNTLRGYRRRKAKKNSGTQVNG